MEDRVDQRRTLSVPNVQELAESAAVNGVPERYMRPETKSELVVAEAYDGAAGSLPLPVIDLGKLLDASDVDSHENEMAMLKSACRDWGFFQLVNHGFPYELMEKISTDIHDFFKLPLEQKKVFAQLPGNIQGYGQAFVQSSDQKLDWADALFLVSQPIHSRDLSYWPTQPPTLRNTMDDYSTKAKDVAASLLLVLADVSGIGREVMSDIFRDQPQHLRINYYPPCQKCDDVVGISPHTDATGLTLLLHLNDVPGLQIKKDGRWFSVLPLPGAFVVNIGDVLEILSNGRLRSIEHRAMVNNEKERVSIAAFHGPRYDSVLGPFAEIVKEEKAKYKTMSYVEYMEMYLSAKLGGRSLLEGMRL